MTQLELTFDAPSIAAFFDRADRAAYDELVPRSFPGFLYILADFRIGKVWHRVIETRTTSLGNVLAVSSYEEPWSDCDPVRMTLAASWHFPLGTTVQQIAAAISDGMSPEWVRPLWPRVSA